MHLRVNDVICRRFTAESFLCQSDGAAGSPDPPDASSRVNGA